MLLFIELPSFARAREAFLEDDEFAQLQRAIAFSP
jgi:hypothetical protein